jgi:signal transduction histidine kinase/ActR/RegA family two-component response regulator
LGQIARALDEITEKLHGRTAERDTSEKVSLNRSFQQTVVSALGQFALVSEDLPSLLNQAVMLVSQTLEVEYGAVLELEPDRKSMVLRSGIGWREGVVGSLKRTLEPGSLESLVLSAGEPIVIENLALERRFWPPRVLLDHGVVSGVVVAIKGQRGPCGLLGAYTSSSRKFLGDEVQFLLAVATVVAMAVERERTQAQLLQAQKMESVGRLAAGVAHDFNNMLTIIQGHSGMLLSSASASPEVRSSAQAVLHAAERAANLTRQLLLFSRKKVMQSQTLDFGLVLSNTSKMLQRLIGETVELKLKCAPGLPAVEGDESMLDQVLMNLAVNARDAMPRGGTLTLEAVVVDIKESRDSAASEARPGRYIRLAVTDTGSGMDRETMRRIFEPFFTTKESGKGTGLGLATVYGIVKQHGGWIEVISEIGKGTTFSIFLPASTKQVESASKATLAPVAARGRETILVVEDEPLLREMAKHILESHGYSVLIASTGAEALEVWEKDRDKVDLLLTDMVMPAGISGLDLARRLQDEKPRLRVVFVSGYSMEDLDTSFLQENRITLLEKPYTHVSLTRSVRQLLDESKSVSAPLPS